MEIKAIEKSIPVQTFIAYRISEYHFHFNPTFIGRYFKFNKKKYSIMKNEMPSQKKIFGSNGAR